MKGLFGLFLISAWFSLFQCYEAQAQRYKRDELATMENVKFEAFRNGGTIEFIWDINSTRDIKNIEIRKGSAEPGKLNWSLVKRLKEDEDSFTEFNPSLGEMHYKLVLIAEDGTEREYLPEFKLKGRS
ncbi:MAG: hypothetical protein JJU28_12475 [Cyclobacteriaceae bacterium]|nr:hypothetical protein [Cyclobacteriaceae bacterium]